MLHLLRVLHCCLLYCLCRGRVLSSVTSYDPSSWISLMHWLKCSCYALPLISKYAVRCVLVPLLAKWVTLQCHESGSHHVITLMMIGEVRFFSFGKGGILHQWFDHGRWHTRCGNWVHPGFFSAMHANYVASEALVNSDQENGCDGFQTLEGCFSCLNLLDP